MLIVFGALRLGHRSIEKAERTIDFLERMRTSLNIIESQIQSFIPLTYDDNGEKKLYFKGQKTSLQFSTNYSIWSGQRGYANVIYNIEQDYNGKIALYATENTISRQDPRKILLLRGFDEISFQYFFKDPLNEDGEWRDEWTETASLPDIVAIFLSERARKISINMHVKLKNKSLQSVPSPTVPLRRPERGFPRQGGAAGN